MKNIQLLILLFCITTSVMFADNAKKISATKFLQVDKSKEFLASTARVQEFKISSNEMNASLQGVEEIEISNFPITLRELGTVVLQKGSNVMDDFTTINFESKNGNIKIAVPEMDVYKGYIAGKEDSKVFLNITDGVIIGFVESDGIRHIISPNQEGETTKLSFKTHYITPEKDFRLLGEETSYKCTPFNEISEDEITEIMRRREEKKFEHKMADFSKLLEVEMAVEVDGRLYTRFNGDIERITRYVNTIWSMANYIYQEQLNIQFKIVHLNILDPDTDPYGNETNIGVLLQKFLTQWNGTKSNVKRDVAHLMTFFTNTSGAVAAGGIARLNGLCSNTQGYAVSGVTVTTQFENVYPTRAYTWDVMVVSHETGHSLGTSHTHNCDNAIVGYVPPIDTCVVDVPINVDPLGTGDACVKVAGAARRPLLPEIMSYCHLRYESSVRLIFTPRVANRIRDYVESKIGTTASRCVSEPTKIVALTYPLGYRNDQNSPQVLSGVENLKWAYSSDISQVKLEYSTNSGSNWILIEDNVPATAGRNNGYAWSVPDVNTNNGRIKISAVNDPSVFDESIANFAIQAQKLTLTAPVGGDELGQGDRFQISWTKQNVENVKVEFYNGTSWQTLIASTPSVNFQWDVPAIGIDNAKIRVTDVGNPQLVSESEAFSIGVPTLTVVKPLLNDSICIGFRNDISWNSRFVGKVRIRYSDDGGNFKNTSGGLNLDGSLGNLNWNVPSGVQPTTTGRIEFTNVTAGANQNTVLVTLNNVEFKNCVPTSVNDFSGAETVFSIMDIVPNPAKDKAVINVNLFNEISTAQLDLTITSVKGEELAKVFLPNPMVGINTISLPLQTLASGTYYVFVRYGSFSTIKQLTVVK